MPFEAEPSELGGLRRVLRLHLTLWGLPDLIEAAQICVTELISNVIRHVGAGAPATLAVSMNGTYLRLELHDPDTRALPTLLDAGRDAEAGRGMVLVDAITDRWGVILRADSKVVWCELATDLTGPNGHSGGPRVARAEEYLTLYGAARHPRPSTSGRLALAVAEEWGGGKMGAPPPPPRGGGGGPPPGGGGGARGGGGGGGGAGAPP
ncbi:ATP-binding protein, partial [Streptomyces sp. NPDC058572]|uniref:ATP-binding protein n=1 Tax=Streptomyces sp. NPDC058572 TaxID=3346546 RepID=UPI0036507DFC